MDTGTPTPAYATTNPSRGGPPYTVFISHAGEDKTTIAIPLREKLRAKGITAFVDETDMSCGTHAPRAMIHAMKTAKVGVMILSPEFVARKWPMKEAMCFVKRYDESMQEGHGGNEVPTIIPCFYRLSVHDIYKEPRVNSTDPNDKLLYEQSRFFERQRDGELEADVAEVKATLGRLHEIMGVVNHFAASNATSVQMSKRRKVLLDELCEAVCKSVDESMRMGNLTDATQRRNDESHDTEGFRRWFPAKLTSARAVLDFDSRNAYGSPSTPEGKIKKQLLAENGGSVGVISVCGLGGVGKSTIVEALMSEDDVRKCFADGMYLIKLGSDAKTSALLERICNILELSGAGKKMQSLRDPNNADEVLECFMKWFEGNRCVFFIDDVWKHNVNVQALSRLCDIGSVEGGNKVLMTTREDEIASWKRGGRIIRVDARESRGEVARKMLMFHAGDVGNNVNVANAAEAISEILEICAGLPVSLAVAGKNMRKLSQRYRKHEASEWARYASQLRANREWLLQEDVESYGNLYATLAVSLKFLDDARVEPVRGLQPKCSYREMYGRLCVLQKQAAVPNTMLKHLWETESEEDAKRIAEAFAEVGLGIAEKVESESGSKWSFSLHDSVHDFAVSEARRHGKVAKAHEILIEGYGSGHEEVTGELEEKQKARRWSSRLEDDGYIHKELCRHLFESGRKTELCELLLTPVWAARQTEVNGIRSVEEEFGRWMKEVGEDEETKEALHLIANAVVLSLANILRNERELWFQLHGRLIGCAKRNKVIEKYLKEMESDWAKPRVLSVNRVLVGAGGPMRKVIPVEGHGVMCMSLFPDEERVACGCWDGRVVVVNIRQGKIEREWQAYTKGADGSNNPVYSLAVSQNGTRIVTMPEPGPRRRLEESGLDVWEAESGQHVMKIGGGGYEVDCFAITHDETCVAVVGKGALQMWNLSSGEIAPAIHVGIDAWEIVLFKDGERAIIEYMEDKLKIWNIRTGVQVGELGDESMESNFWTITPDGRGVVNYSSRDATLRLWDLESGQEVWTSRIGMGIRSVVVSKDGSRIAVGDMRGAIHILDLKSGNQVCEPLIGHTRWSTGVSFLGNKDMIVSCSFDGTVRVWDVVQGQNETASKRHGDAVSGVSFTPDGKFVVSGSWDRTMQIWDAANGQAVSDPLKGHSDWVNGVAVTPDGRFVVSVSEDKSIRVWDLESRKLLHTFEGHTGGVRCVAVTPKGDRVVTGSRDKTVRVWDLARLDGSHAVLQGHDDHVRRTFFSDDGFRVTSVNVEDNVFVWSIETKEVLKKAFANDACLMSRREVFGLVGEDTVHDEAGLSICCHSNQILHGKRSEARELVTLDTGIVSWDVSPDKKTLCVGLLDGQVAFLKIEV